MAASLLGRAYATLRSLHRECTANVFNSSVSAEDAYRSNIQIADLNALNAVLAVGTWKRLCGFYVDQV